MTPPNRSPRDPAPVSCRGRWPFALHVPQPQPDTVPTPAPAEPPAPDVIPPEIIEPPMPEESPPIEDPGTHVPVRQIH